MISLRRRILASAVAGVAIVGLAGAAGQDRPGATAVQALAQELNRPHAQMLRYPAVSQNQIVFSYANDLYIVPREGGVARPLASPPGPEMNPRFSPDGSKIAFVGNYDGNRDIYIIDTFGGVPQRLTYHPASEMLNGWASNDTVLYSASGMSSEPVARQTHQMYTQRIDGNGETGGLPEQLPIPFGHSGQISQDGKYLAYIPHSTDFRTWKRYRGGMATDIWLFDLEEKTSELVTDWEGTDTAPMLHGGKLYYLSDETENYRLNLFRYDPETQERTQLTDFTDFDVKFPSIGPGADDEGEIVFQQGSRLYLLSLAEGAEPREVQVFVPGAKPTLRAQFVDVRDMASSGSIGPTGKRLVLEARGDIWSLAAERGHPIQLTTTGGAAERNPSWSPDGRWIAYSSDEEGEYNIYLKRADGQGKPQKLTDIEGSFFNSMAWAPDSKKMIVQDQTNHIRLVTISDDNGTVTAEVKELDREPTGSNVPISWSHDSRWIAYHRGDEETMTTTVYVCEVESGEKHKLTSDMFNAQFPTFDRKGDWMYYISQIEFASPDYSSADTSFVYRNVDRLVAVPLRKDVKNPMIRDLDEEKVAEEKKEESATRPATRPAEQAAENGQEEQEDDAEFNTDSPIHGEWSGRLSGFRAMGAEEDEVPFTMTIRAHADGSFTGSSEAMGQSREFDSVTFDEESGQFTATGSEGPMRSTMSGKVEGERIEGTWEARMGDAAVASGTWSADKAQPAEEEEAEAETPAAPGGGQRAGPGGRSGAAGAAAAPKELKIDFDGFEERAILLPVPRGNLRSLAVNDKNQLLYVRAGEGGGRGGRGGGEPGEGGPSIRILDITDEQIEEGTVIGGVFGFDMSADGKKLLVTQMGGPGGRRMGVINAAKGQSISKPVPMDGMIKHLEPQEEWKQIVTDAWRRFRDYFYVENMHAVDWDAILDNYLPMVDDAASREDISFIISEMISELNVGHAYYGGGDRFGDEEPRQNVGMLGVDFELAGEGETKAYRIRKILGGASYDLDARGPLSVPGLDVKEGDYVLAVNGRPLAPDVSPYAPFVGLAGRAATLIVSDKPELDPEHEGQRRVVVTPISSESGLRYRDWIAHNARYVDEASDGRIGYIYVPNTGVEGQNDLFRQFFGQMHKDALIIDERWNGGGQIPTRFIELLNRPLTNMWARRHGRDWQWPPDGHNGPKAMLINGLAGSGGDMFPWLFKHNDLGPLIGTRTWGGLVGISGVPNLVDGASVSVPNFGFYYADGRWGIEGHGVDPDIEVIADPTKMQNGEDPQIDAAIKHLLEELEKNPPREIKRPPDPDRSGMGLPEDER